MVMDVEVVDAVTTAAEAVEFKAAALWYAEMGLAVLPLQPKDKEPLYQLVPHGFKDATTDPEQIAAWWAEYPDANLGIAVPEGALVLDVDPRSGGTLDALAELLGGSIPHTWVARSGGAEDGRHVWVQWVEGLNLPKALLRPGIEVKMGGRGYVVAAPSIHPNTGARYEWLDGQAPWDLRHPALPQPLIGQALAVKDSAGTSRDAEAVPTALLNGPQAAKEGERWLRWALRKVQQGEGRNSTGVDLACQLRDNGLTEDAAEPVMLAYQQQVDGWGNHPYPDTEALATLRGVYNRPPRDPAWTADTAQPANRAAETDGLAWDDPRREAEFTDRGNAQRFARDYGSCLKYVPAWGWVAYDDGAWRVGADLLAMRRAKECVDGMLREAAETTDTTRKMKLAQHALKSCQEQRLVALLNVARSEPGMLAQVDDFDTDLWLLNVRNGTLDLRTGAFRPHRADDLLTKQAAIAYDPAATAPRWERFLAEVFAGDTDLVAYVQQALGYSCTGETREHAFFFCYGGGRNGKGTLLNTVRDLLGDYGAELRADALLRGGKADAGRATPELIPLVGARFVTAQEPGSGGLDMAKLKAWTGGDRVSARGNYKAEFSFQPQFKLWLAANHLPDVEDTSDGAWARIRQLPFRVKFDGQAKDLTLVDTLRAEASGILNWLLAGVRAWQQQGRLVEPEAVAQATAAYHAEADPYLEFFTDVLVKTDPWDPKARVNPTEAYQAFQRWNAQAGGEFLTNQAFYKLAASRGIPKQKVGSGYWLLGCRLLLPDLPGDDLPY